MERRLSQNAQKPKPARTSHSLQNSLDRRQRQSISCSDSGTLDDTASQSSWKSPAEAGVHPREPNNVDDELDIAPVDQPPDIQAQQDREPFAVLARHLSGVSVVSKQETSAESGNAAQPFDPPPDGGFQAWSVVMGAWFVLFVQFGIITSFGQFEEYYASHQLSHLPKQKISWCGSLSTFCVFFFSIFSGRYFDAHGPRLLIIGGTTIGVVALFCLAFCKEYYQFILAHLLFGIAGGIVYNPCTSCVAHWFLRKRATAVGLILCGSGLGGVLLPIMLSRLFPQIGFRNSVLALAGVATVLFLPSWFTVKARLPPKKGVPWSHVTKPWKEVRYTVFVLGVAMVWMNYFSPYFYANDFALSQGIPRHIATYATAILNAGSFTGRALSGPMAERFGVIEVFIASGAAGGISVLVLWSSRDVGTAGSIIGLFLYGLFGGAVIALVAACCAQISPVREFGLRLGMMWTIASLPLLAGPQICGVLIEEEKGYTTFSIFSGVTIITGSLMAFAPVMWKRFQDHRRRSGRVKNALEEEKS
ncbi:hypothetical protein NliqN6_3668 [Naganishia liquefaciens]|uniref:Major facilitator superfamily (MFS) profile domain-containing protein n=1 Tax=Naganishia liquefaciens TaxID=104408 RepID=A0A8H3YH36_9TREE|nr:hypothetical protein NliqN6_3668 [Naganishia liquefaciens]